MEGLGERIRALRKQRGLVLTEVAAATGLSIGFLSLVERALAAPSLSSLALIAGALGADMTALLQPQPPAQAVTRQAGRVGFAVGPQSVTYERLSANLPGRTLNSLKLQVPPGYLSETSTHPGEEFVYVLAGSIRYVVGAETFDLATGDSLHFRAAVAHWVQNVTPAPAELISVGTLDLFGDAAPDAAPVVSRADSPGVTPADYGAG